VECYSESAIAGCYRSSYGRYDFWTAGQRLDLADRYSRFVWRVTSTDTYSDTVYAMTYTKWYIDSGSGSCTYIRIDGRDSYEWRADECHDAMCSVCEIDV